MRNFKMIWVTALLLGAWSTLANASIDFNVKDTRDAVPGEYVVKMKSTLGILSSKSVSRILGAKVVSTFDGDSHLFLVKSSGPTMMATNPAVEYMEPNQIFRLTSVPNDPSFGETWGLKNTGQLNGVAGVDINADKAWDVHTGSGEVLVAIIDTGINYTHPDLVDNVWTNEAEQNGVAGVDDDGNGVVDDIHGFNAVANNGDPMDDHSHGSHVAGTIGASANNGVGVAGVNWKVKMMGVKFLSKEGSGTLAGAIKAIDYASKMGAKVLNNSWGGGGFNQSLKEAIERSYAAGALFVAAAGNDGLNNDTRNFYPANYEVPNVLSVAAIDSKGMLASFSNYGATKVHVAAPGVKVFSTVLKDGYAAYSGTSMATPHVAGVAALTVSWREFATVEEFKAHLIKTSRSFNTLSGKIAGGIIDAHSALTN